MSDYSTHPTFVEYTVHSLHKGQSPRRAAASTAKKHNNTTNLLVGHGDRIEIDPRVLEESVWDRLVNYALVAMSKIKTGKEHYALDGTLLNFSQKSSHRQELKDRIIRSIGSDPFPNDGT
jgi:hypothetical protein